MAKQLTFSEESRRNLKKGLDTLANAVKVTLGPRGRNVLIDRKYGAPLSTKDGVTVAKEIDLKDPQENMGAQMIREVAEKTADQAGDGTTTATVLAQSIAAEGLRNVTSGANPMALKRGIDKATEVVIEALKKVSKPVKSSAEIAQVGTISANGDQTVGKLLADALDKVGKEGVITIEESKTAQTYLEVVEGMQFDRGYLSPYFVTNADRLEAVLTDCAILLYEKKISAAKDIIPLLEKTVSTGKQLLIIADDLEGEALALLVVNKIRGALKVCAIKAPGFGDRRKAMMQDLAALTGGKFISEDLGLELSKIDLEDLGRAKRIVVDKDNTTIVEGAGKKQAIDDRIKQIRNEIEKTDPGYDREKLEERLAKLTGGVAILKVGGSTEPEMKERKARVEDALHATRAAMEEGIVSGGGVALLRTKTSLDSLKLSGDEAVGVSIVRRALEEPIRQIARNAGFDGSVTVQAVEERSGNYGFDADSGEFGDLVAKGIIDPTKVVRNAILNASSIASLLMTTEASINDKPKEKKDKEKAEKKKK